MLLKALCIGAYALVQIFGAPFPVSFLILCLVGGLFLFIEGQSTFNHYNSQSNCFLCRLGSAWLCSNLALLCLSYLCAPFMGGHQ